MLDVIKILLAFRIMKPAEFSPLVINRLAEEGFLQLHQLEHQSFEGHISHDVEEPDEDANKVMGRICFYGRQVLKVRACLNKTDDKVFELWATKNKKDFESVLREIPSLLEENERYDPDEHHESLKGPIITKSNLPKKVIKELVRQRKYTKQELEYTEEDVEQTCWSSAKKIFCCQSTNQDDDASNDDESNDRRKQSCWDS